MKRFASMPVVIALSAALVVAIGLNIYAFASLNDRKYELGQSSEKILALEEQNKELGGTLSLTQSEKEDLDSQLEKQKEKNQELKEEKDMYRKLAKTDKQLLAKYSKVYFLNENYSPTKLATITPEYVLPAGKERTFLKPALPYLEDLLEDAKEDGINLRVVSAYRSFDEQKSLKSAYTVTYGAGTANSFSAEQGYSEHQLGTAVDFGTPEVPGAMSAFQNTAAYQWLLENAYKHGFIISYPRNNSYYIYEPWHWRYVGEDLARDLHREGKYFYDMDQREIDEYLLTFFD